MAELVLSALLPLVFEKLASTAVKTIARHNGIDAEIKKLQRSLTQIQGVLTDASHKEITSPPVKRWLNDLQHLAYDIDDVLDELATEAMHREFNHESEGIGSKVRKLIPSCCTNFSRNTTLIDKLDDITVKLKDLIDEKAALGLKVLEEDQPRSKNKNRRLQTSLFDASSIVGRKLEKAALVHELLGGESAHQNFSIVPILGMGGVGKTTLAKLVYDDDQVKGHFELKAWVCVSDDFDSFAISKVIYQSVTKENNHFADLNLLQEALKKHLNGKHFLLVLDDVWSESSKDWETLVGPFHACAPGSKIIITTRKDQLLKKLRCNQLKQLEILSHEDALSLIALQALHETSFDSHLSLKPHAEGIVKKCHRLPLALKALGGLLSSKNEEEQWKKVLDSEIWNLRDVEDEIIPELKLSYHDLSARLKQLFAYCSLFPKDFVFDKEELVLLWMAEGFLHQSPANDSTEENMGLEYFDELFSRSFFQHAPNNEERFIMHDMMNDLATSVVAGDFFVRLDNEANNSGGEKFLEKHRHMSFIREEYVTYKKFENFKRAKSLRTFLATSVGEVESWRRFYLSNKILVDLLVKLPLLRVLCLSGFRISEVPESIGTLRHLRYLNLSRTSITCLPESVGNLYNLETLILFDCSNLAKLPNNFLKLKKLRHLDIKGTSVVEMPLGIDDLKTLQTLSKIIVGDESRFDIAKLKEFKTLCGKTSIVGLDKVKNAIHAREANFSQKRFTKLDLVWSDGSQNYMLEKEVLNELKPCNDKLIKLEIRSYGGFEFPNWVGDPSFLGLKHVSIQDCQRCTSLPPLGQLPFLKELFIGGLNEVKVVGMELLGTCHEFATLEILCFQRMSGWTKWSTNRGVVFPCLKQLLIGECPNLVEVTLEALPSLNVLEIDSCDSGVLRNLVQVASSVSDLEIRSILGLNDAVWRGVIEYVCGVEELRIHGCNEIRYLWESEAVASKWFMNLKELYVYDCDNLVSLGEKEDEDTCRSNLLTSLKILKVSSCVFMERFRCPYSIEELDVGSCESITDVSLPAGGQKLKSFEISGCKKLLEREWGVQEMESGSLEYVKISGWSNLKSIIGLNYMVGLTELNIRNCEGLESFPDNELPNLTSLKTLQISACPGMDACFPRGFWPPKLQILIIESSLKKPILEWGPQNFPSSLVDLSLYNRWSVGSDGVSSLDQISHLLPSTLISLEINAFRKLESDGNGLQHLTSLQSLRFENCPNLKKLSNLQHLTSIISLHFHCCPNLSTLSLPQHLTSLQHLEFGSCPKMMDLPEALLPSLLTLSIGACSEDLKERCSKGGSYWPLISHIPRINIR